MKPQPQQHNEVRQPMCAECKSFETELEAQDVTDQSVESVKVAREARVQRISM